MLTNLSPDPLRRNSVEARKVAKAAYGFRCCVICGVQMDAVLELAHLDQHAGNNDPDNLAWFCGTHHRMYDCGLYPEAAIKLLRARWQETKGVPDHKPRMKDAGGKGRQEARLSIAWIEGCGEAQSERRTARAGCAVVIG